MCVGMYIGGWVYRCMHVCVLVVCVYVCTCVYMCAWVYKCTGIYLLVHVYAPVR